MSFETRLRAESSTFARRPGWKALVAGLLLFCAGPSPVSADGSDGDAARGRDESRHGSGEREGAVPLWVLPPGQERTASVMLGGAEGVGGCTYTNARVERERIVAAFECASGRAPFTIVMSHPDAWRCPGECTSKFALAVRSGTPPPGFLAALAARVSAHEGRIVWTTPGGRSRLASWIVHYVPRPGPTLGLLALLVVAVLIARDRRRPGRAD